MWCWTGDDWKPLKTYETWGREHPSVPPSWEWKPEHSLGVPQHAINIKRTKGYLKRCFNKLGHMESHGGFQSMEIPQFIQLSYQWHWTTLATGWAVKEASVSTPQFPVILQAFSDQPLRDSKISHQKKKNVAGFWEHAAIAVHDAAIAVLDAAIAVLDSAIAVLDSAIAVLDSAIAVLAGPGALLSGEEHLHWCGGFSERGHLGSGNLKALQINASATDVGHSQWGWWYQHHPCGWRSVIPTLCGKNSLFGSSDAFHRCSDNTEMLYRYIRLLQLVHVFQDFPISSRDDKSI